MFYRALLFMCVFFFFKQKTAYEMRISDWSSDVCSSYLPHFRMVHLGHVVIHAGRSKHPLLDHHCHFLLMLGMHGRRANVEFMKKLTAIADAKANCFALFHGDLRGLEEIVADGDLDRAIGLGRDAGGTYRGAFAMPGIGEQ